MEQEDIIRAIEEKYVALGEKPATYLQGLFHARPLCYWDYVEVDTLLSLQKPRTNFKDEEVFIMYHQVTELVLKLMLHEIRQVAGDHAPNEELIVSRLDRLCRYTNMLITSFSVMKDGMSYVDYNLFRTSLAPASGFQSVQFRYIELYCTRIANLVSEEGKNKLGADPSEEECLAHIYWKNAGINRATGKKTMTLQLFEEKYHDDLLRLTKAIKGNTLEDKVLALPGISPRLREKLREFDRLYNVEWPLVHLDTARHYLDSKGEAKAATGGSDWKKYLHPQSQQRKFFPTLWNADENEGWGKTL